MKQNTKTCDEPSYKSKAKQTTLVSIILLVNDFCMIGV